MSTYPPVVPPNGKGFTKTSHTDTYPFIHSSKSDLRGRSVFITGASKGVGRATAISYGRAGASHIGLGARSSFGGLKEEIISAAKEAGHPEPAVLELKLDVQDRESIRHAAKSTKDAFGTLDILVNNAGYLESFMPLLETNEDEYLKTWNVNYTAVYLVTKDFLPLVLASNLKTVVNLSSIGAHNMRPGASSYQTTKFALLRFTEFLMVDYSSQGLLAFAVHPGGILTDLALNMPKATHSRLLDKPEVAADTIVFLTQKRREWLAGRYIDCTWDMEEFLAKEKEIVDGDKLKMRLIV
jgi:NAD(P)-dependent dehydrogenase (short-subunit alcohol dehydrogenase family)